MKAYHLEDKRRFLMKARKDSKNNKLIENNLEQKDRWDVEIIRLIRFKEIRSRETHLQDHHLLLQIILLVELLEWVFKEREELPNLCCSEIKQNKTIFNKIDPIPKLIISLREFHIISSQANKIPIKQMIWKISLLMQSNRAFQVVLMNKETIIHLQMQVHNLWVVVEVQEFIQKVDNQLWHQ
jgi:hypothetical protein